MQETAGTETRALTDELKARSAEFLRGFVESAIDRGEVRSDIDADLVVHVVNTLTLTLEPYLKAKYGYSHLEQLTGPDADLPFTEEELEADVRALVGVMRSGLDPRVQTMHD